MSALPSKLSSPFARAVLWLVTGLALASAAFLLAQSRQREYRPLEMVLRTYSVAPTLEAPLRQALKYTLDVRGRVIETGVGGQLLIAAPQPIHDQIPALLASFANTSSEAPTLLFDVWYVVGIDGPANLDEPGLQAIRGALEQAVKVEGAKRFEIRQRKAVRVQVGADAEARPLVEAILGPRLAKRADGTQVITARLFLGTERGALFSELKTKVELVPGETLVIGQTGYKNGERLETLYQIVRASL